MRKVYVYTEDAAGNVSATAGTATLDFPLPSALAMTGPSSIPQSGCSDPITISATDSYGLSSPSNGVGSVTLSGAGSGAFYSDAGCTTAATQTLDSGASSVKVYFKSGTTGALTLQADGFSATATVATSVDRVYQISTGSDTIDGFTCAVIAGAAQCWGDDDFGQLGNNDMEYSTTQSVAVAVSGLGSGVSEISAGDRFACAVVDGAAKCWGDNWTGQLGRTTGSNYVPDFVNGLTSGVRSISAGDTFGCVVAGEGAKCWGVNDSGQLGME